MISRRSETLNASERLACMPFWICKLIKHVTAHVKKSLRISKFDAGMPEKL